MKRIKSILGGIAVACTFGTAALAQTTIYYGHSGPARGTMPVALDWFDSRINELSGGDLRMDVSWGGALFKAPAALQGVSNGVADAGTLISAYFQKELAAYSLADLPIAGANIWVGLRATDKLMRETPEITEYLAEQNLVYIGTFTGTDVNVACRGVEINSISDIEGKKVRGTGVYGKVFDSLGATMVNLNVYEAYQGFDTGMIDCSQGYTYIMPALKWLEVVDSFTILNWGQVGGAGMFMNKQVYDDLTDAQRDVLAQAGTEMADQFAKIAISATEKAMGAMQSDAYESKLKIINLSQEEVSVLHDATQPFIEEWIENANSVGLDGEALLASFKQSVAELTAEFEDKGYPWTR